MSEKMGTKGSLNQRFQKAQAAKAAAAERFRKLQSDVAARNTKMLSQRKFVLGHALIQACEAQPQLAEIVRHHLLKHITRPRDLEAISCTAFAPLAEVSDGA